MQVSPLPCATNSTTFAEPLAGTAAVASTWMCLEQPGPWGHNALLESQLDTALGRALSARADASGIRLQLIRRPGQRAAVSGHRPQRAYLAHTHPGRTWLRAADLSDPAQLLDLDFDRVGDGTHDGWGRHVDGPLLMVCTNGRRDRCCAVHGRALTGELAPRYGDSIWETTHTGGHRFAPAAVLLPTGYTYGRMDARSSNAALSAAASGKVTLTHCRGRSSWSRHGQAAELAIREREGEYLADSLRVAEATPAGVTPTEATDGATTVTVVIEHDDSRRWTVTTHEEEVDPPRPTSCGKAAVRPVAIVVDEIRPAPGQ